MVLNITIIGFPNNTGTGNQSVSPIAELAPIASSSSLQTGQASRYCWNWCREQHFANQSNLTIEGISIIALALIVLFIYNLLIKYWEHIEIEGINKTRLKRFVDLLPELVIYLLIGFFVWFVWFS